jgi:hypothetical protein
MAGWHQVDDSSTSPSTNPTGLPTSNARVIRSGSWLHTRWDIWLSVRCSLNPENA